MFFLAVFLALFLMAIVYPRSRYLTIVISLFMLFVYAFTWREGDLEIYDWVYRDLFTGQFYTRYEPGFIASMWVCRKIGLSFTGFRFVLGAFITFNLYHIIRRQTDYSSIVMALYCLFPFFMFSYILRSGISCVFLLIAIEKIISEKRDKKKFILYILLGTLFHYSCILFLPFLFFTGKAKKKLMIGVFVGMCVLSLLIRYTNVLYLLVSKVTQRQKILQWLIKNDATANTKGTIAIIILLGTLYILSRYNIRKYAGFVEEYSGGGVRNNQIQICYQLSAYMLFLFPLMVLSSPMMRLPYMIFLMFIISSVNVAFRNNERYIDGWSDTIVIPLSLVALLFVVLMWKFYADLPYIKSGAHLFGEYVDAHFLW